MYVGAACWQFAKTMPDWPHEYTVKSWDRELGTEFEAFCQFIEDHGAVEPWPPSPAEPIYHNRYLVVGEYKYWAMGPLGDSDAVSDKTVINRLDWSDLTLGKHDGVQVPVNSVRRPSPTSGPLFDGCATG